MEILTIKKIKAMTTLGVKPEEKKAPREIFVSLDIDISNSKVFESGKLQDTIDYDDLVKDLRGWLKKGKWELVENLADDIAKKIIDERETNYVKVTVEKPEVIEDVEAVMVTVTQEYKSSKPMGFSGKVE